MSLDQISFLLGGSLVAVGLLGGGLEIRDLRIPAIGHNARILSVVGGVAFIGLALFLTLRHPEQTSTGTSSTNPIVQPPTPQRETFPEPMYGGFRLDACYESNTRCGEEPATAWCKMKGFGRAVEHPEENVGTRGIHTKQIGSQLECSFPFCASFKYITCES